MGEDIETIFLKTVESNKDRIFRICRSYSADSDDAKDLFQEVLLNLWKSLPSFKYKSNIDTWVYRITINICLRTKQFSDKKQKHFVKLESIHIENIEDIITPNENEILFLKLSECIKKLEGMEKSIILLHLEGIPYKEIAQIFGLTENHVAVKIKRIKNKLQTCIKSLSNARR
jgi:RNA polymerase sigma-70 factor (ECF subfamily)